MKINGSIVLYKNPESELVNLLEVFTNSKITNILYIVDNSPDIRLKKICKRFPKTCYIKTNNIGYGSGHNIALKKSLNNCDFHVVMNVDINFDEFILEKLGNFMIKNNDIGLVMPKILSDEGVTQNLCKLVPSPVQVFLRRFVFCKKILKKINYTYEMQYMDYNKSFDVPILSGCFMFLKNSVFYDVGFFDENFFMYFEDVDYSRRIGKKYRTVYYPNVEVTHLHKKESYKSLKILKHHIKSAVYYFNKYGWFNDQDRKTINKKFLQGVLK